MPEYLARTSMFGAAVWPEMSCAGRSTIDWITPTAMRAQPTTTSAIGTRRTCERIATGAILGRSETLVTRCAGARRDQHRVFHQIAGKHRFPWADEDHRLARI